LAERAAKIGEAAERCTRIVNNFLGLARRRPPERQMVKINEVIEEAIELLSYELRVESVEVILDLATDLPSLWADPHQLHQVVVNLISNAHHAMRQTSPPRRITLTSRFDPVKERVSLEVADTGPGIPPEIRSRIFQAFFTTKPPGQGTGLGLSLCQGIIENHGGTIAVESGHGQGAVFRIQLPVEPAPQAAVSEVAPTPALPPLRGKTILVVDDEPEIVAVLTEMISADGQLVETAANGALALDKLRGRSYDLIVTDIKMPELDGLGLWREMERRDPGLLRRIIFVTGDTLGPETKEFLKETGVPCLAKPFVEDEVLAAVQRALRAE
jgi:two-component system NtrC family sensor kinase